ncbi:MAG: DNA recombination protein RmuC [Pseudomonadota bacterium]
MDTALLLALCTVAALAAGVLLGWWLGGTRARQTDARMETELRQQIAGLEQRLGEFQLAAREAGERRARAEADADALRRQLAAAEEQHARRIAERDAFARQQLDEQKENHARVLLELRNGHDKALADLKESFKALSADALKENTPAFLALAQENLGKLQAEARGDLETRKKEIEALLKPLQEQLSGYQALSQQSQKSIGEVVQQLNDLKKTNEVLASETSQFRNVLNNNQARGRWGEETLRRVVEAAGMSAHCDFDVQVSEGDSRPDMIVRLPEERVIIVDAKVPDLDFISALETSDPEARTQSLRSHAQKLKQTIKALADRDYPRRFANSLDYVVLFLPAESLFSAALEGDRDLLVWAGQQRIIVATPASLIALLRSVSISWQQYAQTQNTQLIADTAKELYQRVAVFYEHFEGIGDAVGKAAKAFNRAVASYDSRVRPTGERLLELKVDDAGKQLPALDPVEENLRLPRES